MGEKSKNNVIFASPKLPIKDNEVNAEVVDYVLKFASETESLTFLAYDSMEQDRDFNGAPMAIEFQQPVETIKTEVVSKSIEKQKEQKKLASLQEYRTIKSKSNLEYDERVELLIATHRLYKLFHLVGKVPGLTFIQNIENKMYNRLYDKESQTSEEILKDAKEGWSSSQGMSRKTKSLLFLQLAYQRAFARKMTLSRKGFQKQLEKSVSKQSIIEHITVKDRRFKDLLPGGNIKIF